MSVRTWMYEHERTIQLIGAVAWMFDIMYYVGLPVLSQFQTQMLTMPKAELTAQLLPLTVGLIICLIALALFYLCFPKMAKGDAK